MSDVYTPAESVRVRKNLLGDAPVEYMTRKMSDILTMNKNIVFDALYQRELCWPIETINGLIATVMECFICESISRSSVKHGSLEGSISKNLAQENNFLSFGTGS